MPERRRIAVLTSGRQDHAILRSTLLALDADPRFELRLLVGGMHLRDEHGRTVDQVRQDGLRIHAELPFRGADPSQEAAAALAEVAEALGRIAPDALVLLGDRAETLAAAFAATLVGVPIVHLHGGEETEGAIDNAMRHAITKLAHLHLVSHARHAARVRQMGEADARVHVVGAPGLDHLHRSDLPDRAAIERSLGRALPDPVVLVTLHPTTLGGGDPDAEVEALGAAMAEVPARYVVTLPNADAGGARIREAWVRWAEGRDDVCVVAALGGDRYWGLLRLAGAVLGNSSSGIIEAPAAGVPVVDVGDRQKGRLTSRHVVNVPFETPAIRQALAHALTAQRRAELSGEPPLYPAGPAAPRIVEALLRADLARPPRKPFVDRAFSEGSAG